MLYVKCVQHKQVSVSLQRLGRLGTLGCTVAAEETFDLPASILSPDRTTPSPIGWLVGELDLGKVPGAVVAQIWGLGTWGSFQSLTLNLVYSLTGAS